MGAALSCGLALASLLLAGCRDQAKQISQTSHLLDSQNQAWSACLEACQKGQPDFGKLRVLGGYLCERTRKRAEVDYTKANKAQVIALLDELGQEFQQNVMLKMYLEGYSIHLNPGVTDQDICNAVLALKDRYQKLIEMTKD
jgi:outer membrane biogenesis lipoprotein LolB